MTRLDFDIDDSTLLRHYRLSSLEPAKWEDVDYDAEETLHQALSSPTTGSTQDAEVKDPLGLGIPFDFSQIDASIRSTAMTSSKNFDPKAFLSAVHPNLTYQDLTRGISHLKTTIESRSEAIRVLVENDFDRFVAVKSSTDAVYAEMQEGLLSPDASYASRPLKDQLKRASQKADQIFLPVLENSSKTERARSTLGVFERSKFFFNLPGFLQESIATGRYDAALREYKKGKYMLESRQGQLLSSSVSNEDNNGRKLAAQQQRRIVEKVWLQVERVMADMRASLLEKLQAGSSGKSVEEQERTIEILLELGGPDDPVWVFLDSQHRHILAKLKEVYGESVKAIDDAKSKLSAESFPNGKMPEYMASQLCTCLDALKLKQSEAVISQAYGYTVWQAILALAKNLSEVIVHSLPLFWKIAKGYMDGKLKKTITGSRRSPAQCRTMALEITNSYITLLSSFFSLSDEAVVSPIQSPISPTSGSWSPASTNSITTALYLSRVLALLSEYLGEMSIVTVEIFQGDVGGENGLKGLLDSVRWKFEDVLADRWKTDAKIFYYLESWELDVSPDLKQTSITLYPSKIESFQRHITTSAFKLAGGLDTNSRPGAVRQKQISQRYINKITKAFLDTMYAFLDGLVHLASEESTSLSFPLENTGTVTGTTRLPSTESSTQVLDFKDCDTRLLLVVSNLVYMHDTLIPTMFNELESAFGISIADERRNALEMTKTLDHTLFDDFVEKKATAVSAIIRAGILDPIVDWYAMPPPTEVRPYMYDALMYLVGVHAHVSKISRKLLERALTAIIEIVATECLACFKEIPRFGMGGMLRATLEIEFMHQTVSQFTTDNNTQAILVEVYNSISQSYSRRAGDEQIQKYLDGVKKTLAEARKSTHIAFMCFRQSKGDADKKAKAKMEKEAVDIGISESEPLMPPTPRPPRRRDRI